MLPTIKSFKFALAGLRSLLSTQRNARFHLAASMGVIILAWLLEVGSRDWLWLMASIGAVWAAEAMNTAVELLGDAIAGGENEKVGRAKDVAAAGVLIVAFCAAIIGTLIFGPLLLNRLFL